MAEHLDLTWRQFELAVKNTLRKLGADLESFRVMHNEHVVGVDGTYQVDVLVRFEALDVNFVVLVECKNWRERVKREHVQVLRDRIASTGSQKGILFSTGGFQSGAIDYAKTHGIALVYVTSSGMEYFSKAENRTTDVPTGTVPRFTLCTEPSKPFNAGDDPVSLRVFLGL